MVSYGFLRSLLNGKREAIHHKTMILVPKLQVK